VKIQLTLEQHGFELCGSIYMEIFCLEVFPQLEKTHEWTMQCKAYITNKRCIGAVHVSVGFGQQQAISSLGGVKNYMDSSVSKRQRRGTLGSPEQPIHS
jgi:hypothetical protein